jgi:predicted DNA-binding transcriptional regulator AlpA
MAAPNKLTAATISALDDDAFDALILPYAEPRPSAARTIDGQPVMGFGVGDPPAASMLRASQVCARLAISKATLHRYIARGDFPRPIKYSHKVARWRPEAIEKWLSDRDPASKSARKAAR